MNAFIDFKKLIPKAIAKYNMARETRAAQVCARFRVLAPEIVGADVLKNARPLHFKGGTLTVAVPNSLWAQMLTVHRHDLIMKMNLDFQAEWVREIRTRVET